MAIDSIYIVAQNSEIIAHKSYFGQNRRKVVEEFSNQYSKILRNNALTESPFPILNISGMICIYHTLSDFVILIILTAELPVLLVHSLIQQLADVLKNAYQNELNSEKLKSNFSSLLVMLDHFMEKGQPLIQQKLVLQSLVAPQGVLDKIEEVVIGQNQKQNENFKVLEKYVDGLSDVKDNHMYRIKGLRPKNEILFDLVEFIDCIIDSSGNIINSEINGEMKSECSLSLYPLVSVFMTIPQPFDDFSLHECLLDEAEKFESDKILQFTPPSGNSTLLFYNIKTQICRLPFNLIHNLDISKDVARIDFKLSASAIRGQEYKTDEFYIKVILPTEMVQTEVNTTRGIVSQIDNAMVWKVGSIPKEETIKLNVVLKAKNETNLRNGAFVACLKFQVLDYSASGTKVDKAVIKNSAENPRKGAKCVTKSGHYEIRLN